MVRVRGRVGGGPGPHLPRRPRYRRPPAAAAGDAMVRDRRDHLLRVTGKNKEQSLKSMPCLLMLPLPLLLVFPGGLPSLWYGM